MQQHKIHYRCRYQLLVILIVISVTGASGFATGSFTEAETKYRVEDNTASGFLPADNTRKMSYLPIVLRVSPVYLPLVLHHHPWISPFGVQSNRLLTTGNLLNDTQDLKVGRVRLQRIRWRLLQPEEDGPIQWHILRSFENELRTLRERNITPVVVIYDSPHWATIHPTSCSAVRGDKFGHFAAFVSAVVTRYKAPEFNVQHWELGNEPDVDPRLVGQDSIFGCWGDIDDPFYGGQHYGEMLKVVGPTIRSANPAATIWLGGLLLATPHTTAAERGRPELFLQGILEAGAAPHFDIVPYHWYPSYAQAKIDYDRHNFSPWTEWGGGVVGKARYLRQLMAQYGVRKPVVLNETAFACPNDTFGSYPWCDQPDAQFYQVQADMLVRMFVRGLSADVSGFIWYTIDGPGWRHGGLLDANGVPKPVYTAYQQLSHQLFESIYGGTIDYGEEIEAYLFRKGPTTVQVVWAKEDTTIPITIPQANFVNAFDRNGNLIVPTIVNDYIKLSVGFEAIYIVQWSN